MREMAGFCEGSSVRMQINAEKSGVTHTQGAVFFRYKLLNRPDFKNKAVGIGHTRMVFGVPVERLMKRYADKGFLQEAKKGDRDKYVARYQPNYAFLQPYFLIGRYNAVVKGGFVRFLLVAD